MKVDLIGLVERDVVDDAMAETVIGLFETEVMRRRGPWRGLEDVEFATFAWVEWFDTRRLLEPIGNVPPAELEADYYRHRPAPADTAGLSDRCPASPRRG